MAVLKDETTNIWQCSKYTRGRAILKGASNMTIFFTADQHYNHKNIIRYCNRPFASVEEMNEILIENHNKVVKEKDTVYNLGDFIFTRKLDTFSTVVDRLNGKQHFISGSHDYWAKQLLTSVREIEVIYSQKYKVSIVLCHYAMRVWPKSHYGSWQLYGHSHGRLPLPGIGKQMDVGVDCWNFFPISIDFVVEYMKKQPDNPNLIRKD